jgi:hypothetical protein
MKLQLLAEMAFQAMPAVPPKAMREWPITVQVRMSVSSHLDRRSHTGESTGVNR